MANKHKPTKKRDPNQMTATGTPGEDLAVALARTVLDPTVQAAVTLEQYGKSYGNLDLSGLADALTEQTSAVIDGDLKRGEAMLTAQAHTLDAVYNALAQHAMSAKYMEHLDCFLKLALRAQSQCRATWEALATIQNPPLVGYARQANIAHTQQVNNGTNRETEVSRTRESKNPQNKVLEQKDGERLDTGEAGTAGGADPELATVGAIDGTKVKRG